MSRIDVKTYKVYRKHLNFGLWYNYSFKSIKKSYLIDTITFFMSQSNAKTYKVYRKEKNFDFGYYYSFKSIK